MKNLLLLLFVGLLICPACKLQSEQYLIRGIAKANQHQYKRAIANFTKAIKINPDYRLAYIKRGNARCELKDLQGGIADYTKAIEIEPHDSGSYYNRGITKSELQDYKGAIADYDKAIEIAPRFKNAYDNRGNAKGQLEDYAGAIADYTKAIEINPDDADTLINNGNSDSELKDYQAADKDFNRAIQVKNYIVYDSRGFAKNELQDTKGAIADYNKAIQINPFYALAYYNRGNVKTKLQDYQGAITDFSKAIELNPIDTESYINRGLAKYELKDYQGAIADYSKAIEINPFYALAYYNRGVVKDDLHDYQGSIADYNKALEINPNDSDLYSGSRDNAKDNLKNNLGAIADFLKFKSGETNTTDTVPASYKIQTDSSVIEVNYYQDYNSKREFNRLKDKDITYFKDYYLDTKILREEGAFTDKSSVGIWKLYSTVGKIQCITDHDKGTISVFDENYIPFYSLKMKMKQKADSLVKSIYSNDFFNKHVIFSFDGSLLFTPNTWESWTEAPKQFMMRYKIKYDESHIYKDLIEFELDSNGNFLPNNFEEVYGFEELPGATVKTFKLDYSTAIQIAKQNGLIETDSTKANAFLRWECSKQPKIYNGNYRYYVIQKNRTKFITDKEQGSETKTDFFNVWVFNPWSGELIQQKQMKQIKFHENFGGYSTGLLDIK